MLRKEGVITLEGGRLQGRVVQKHVLYYYKSMSNIITTVTVEVTFNLSRFVCFCLKHGWGGPSLLFANDAYLLGNQKQDLFFCIHCMYCMLYLRTGPRNK